MHRIARFENDRLVPTTFASLMRRPGAWAPLALSTGALAMILGHIVTFWITQPAIFPPPLPGEGPRRPFELLLLAQLPVIVAFAWTWLRRAPRPAAYVLLLQIALAVLPILLVALLDGR